jgi:hypothetical protein
MGYNKRGNDCVFWGRVTRDAYYKDGGAWKLDAVARITEYLRNNLAGYNVVVIG